MMSCQWRLRDDAASSVAHMCAVLSLKRGQDDINKDV